MLSCICRDILEFIDEFKYNIASQRNQVVERFPNQSTLW